MKLPGEGLRPLPLPRVKVLWFVGTTAELQTWLKSWRNDLGVLIGDPLKEEK